MIEWKGKGYIFIEVKYKDTKVKRGQKIALERLVKDTGQDNKESLAIIAEHNVKNGDKDVDVGNCNIREIYYSDKKIWQNIHPKWNVEELVRHFIIQL